RDSPRRGRTGRCDAAILRGVQRDSRANHGRRLLRAASQRRPPPDYRVFRPAPEALDDARSRRDGAAEGSIVATDMSDRAVVDGRTARKDRNMVAVLDAVLELFVRGDLIPSPEAIAQRSGVSLRSVYRYLAASRDLVHAA